MENQIEGTYEQGYADGRTYYTNDISKQIHEIRTAIRVLDNFAIFNDPEPIKEELLATINILEAILRISKKPY